MNGDTGAKWSAVVAVSLLVAITAIAMTALIRYTVADAKTILDWMGPLIGVVTGAFVGYFFTRGQIQTASQLAKTSTEQAQQSQEVATEARQQAQEAVQRADVLSTAVTRLSGRLDPAEFQGLMNDEAFKRALSPQ